MSNFYLNQELQYAQLEKIVTDLTHFHSNKLLLKFEREMTLHSQRKRDHFEKLEKKHYSGIKKLFK